MVQLIAVLQFLFTYLFNMLYSSFITLNSIRIHWFTLVEWLINKIYNQRRNQTRWQALRLRDSEFSQIENLKKQGLYFLKNKGSILENTEGAGKDASTLHMSEPVTWANLGHRHKLKEALGLGKKKIILSHSKYQYTLGQIYSEFSSSGFHNPEAFFVNVVCKYCHDCCTELSQDTLEFYVPKTLLLLFQ